MARMMAVQHQHHRHPPSSLSLFPSSSSNFRGIRSHACIQYKRKLWQPKGALRLAASSSKKIVRIGHQATVFTRAEAPIIQQIPGELDKDRADFSSKIPRLKGDRKDFEFVKSSLDAEGFDVVCDFPFKFPFAITKAFAVPRRSAMALIFSSCIFSPVGSSDIAFAQPSVVFREYIDTFDGYSFKYPQNWVQVRGAGADIFFRDPYILDENLSVEFSSPSSSRYKSVEELGPPEEAGKKVLKQYLTEFMSTRLGVRRESNIVSTSSRIADDGKMYYQVEVNIKSYANNNELAVMPQERVVRLEWDRRYLSVLGVENNRLYELRLQTPENVFLEEENDLRQVMDSFRVNPVAS